MSLESTKYLRDLRRLMVQYFGMDELETLTFDLGIDWGDLPGDKKSTKSQSLIVYLARRGRLDDLVALVGEERLQVDWPDIPPPGQQMDDGESVGPAVEISVAGRDIVSGETSIEVENSQVSVTGDAVGGGAKVAKDVEGPVIQADTVTLGKARRDEQYETVLHWDGKTRLRGFDLAERDLSELDLRGADLRGADLSNAKLSGVDLRQANLNGANLSGADLSRAKLGIADDPVSIYVLLDLDANWTNLRLANLRDAVLVEADLRYANLTGADMSGARLTRANLRHARLTGADLSRADLNGADLGYAYMWSAVYDSHTNWPEGFDPEIPTTRPYGF